MNNRFLLAAASMGAIAGALGSGGGGVDGPRLRHARKVHARRDDHLKGAWIDPEYSPTEAARRNAHMAMERQFVKSMKITHGRRRLAAGLPWEPMPGLAKQFEKLSGV